MERPRLDTGMTYPMPRLRCLILLLAVLAIAGCADDYNPTLPTPTRAMALTPTPTIPLPPPPPGENPCADSDACSGEHSDLFAIAHSFSDPLNTILYRVTVPPWSTGTSWGDGNNGFFFLATLSGSTDDGNNQTLIYVPFNGIGAGSDGQTQLPQFWFVVPANESVTRIDVTACASGYQAASGTTPKCTTELWTDSYETLPSPSVGEPPFTSASLEIAGTGSTQLSVPNTGVSPGVVTLAVTGSGLDDEAVKWLYDHLVFFDEVGAPYTNDLFSDSSESHRSIGVLSIDEAAYRDPTEGTYHTKYGSTAPIEKVDAPDRQFFFYTRDILGSSSIDVGIDYLYDRSADCPGYTGSAGSLACDDELSLSTGFGAGSSGPHTIVQVLPLSDEGGAVTAEAVTAENALEAGSEEIRSISFRSASGATCGSVPNPLAINDGEAYNQPNYVIDDTSGTWGMHFPHALYYVLPTGFGNCDASTTPFCHLSSGYTAYVPHYADLNGDSGTLNGGSTSAATVGSFALADQYDLGTAGTATSNSLVWFDNCGYGYRYEECATCQYGLGTRKGLPSPPDDFKISQYTISNNLTVPIVLGKECCSSFYQENQSTGAYEPPAELDDGFGAFIPAGGSLVYDTLFSDEATVVYNATTGQQLFKLRLNTDGAAVYGCTGTQWSATVSETAPYAVTIASGSAGALRCAPVGLCPFGMTAATDGATVSCTATTSSFLLGIPDWAAEVGLGTDAVQVRAWGGLGKTGENKGGDGGAAGFALTVLTPADLASNLYAYVAEEGASTVLTAMPLSLVTSDIAKEKSDPSSVGVMLIAGAGGQGEAAVGKLGYFTGGSGGQAIANAEPGGMPASVSGGDGEKSPNGGTIGSGGNPSPFTGAGGGGSATGTAGIGGTSPGSWNTKGSLIPPSSWEAGNGGHSTAGGYTAYGGAGFGGGGAADGGGSSGGGGSWAAANTMYDATAPSSAPDSPNGNAGAVQIIYTCGASGSCPLCPDGTTSVSVQGGAVSCVLESSAAYDVGSWLQSAVTSGLILSDQEIRLTAWGGRGGTAQDNNNKTSGGTAAVSTTPSDLLERSPTLYVYVGGTGVGPSPNGGAATIVIGGQQLGQIDATGDPGEQGVWLIAGGGGGWGDVARGGSGGTTVSTTDGPSTAAGQSGVGCNGVTGAGGNGGVGGTGHANGTDGIGGRGGGGVGWIFASGTTGIDDPSSWSAGQGGEGGGAGGGGWGGGGGGNVGDCSSGGGGGASWAAASTTDDTYGTRSSSSPNGDRGAFELYYELVGQ